MVPDGTIEAAYQAGEPPIEFAARFNTFAQGAVPRKVGPASRSAVPDYRKPFTANSSKDLVFAECIEAAMDLPMAIHFSDYAAGLLCARDPSGSVQANISVRTLSTSSCQVRVAVCIVPEQDRGMQAMLGGWVNMLGHMAIDSYLPQRLQNRIVERIASRLGIDPRA
jgi:hypothetical protein